MEQGLYAQAEAYMKKCLKDSAHDWEHIYRVLYQALAIGQQEKEVDFDVLILACLLHDMGREKELQNPSICHAAAGAEMAYDFLIQAEICMKTAESVRDCIRTHRYRSGNPPESLEAKILFDADKLEAAGTLGIARTLLYQGERRQTVYVLKQPGQWNGEESMEPAASFWTEYNRKLKHLYGNFLHFPPKRLHKNAGNRRSASFPVSGRKSKKAIKTEAGY